MGRLCRKAACICVVFLAVPLGAAQETVNSIAALVNGQVISNYDVAQRIRMTLVTLSLKQTPENMERSRKQVLELLVDETLQRQEAEHLQIRVNPEEFARALSVLARRNNTTPEGLVRLFSENNVKPITVRDRILNEIIWQKVVDRLFRETLRITQEEIDTEYTRALEKALEDRYLVSEIYMSFTDSQEAARVQDLLEGLIKRARAGRSFANLAYRFSEYPSAVKGGALGWITLEEVPSALRPVLRRMRPREISDPIRTQNGFYVLYLMDHETGGLRDPSADTFTWGEFLIPPQRTPSPSDKILEEFVDCSEGEELAQKYDVTYKETGPLSAQEIPVEIRQGLQGRKVGEIFPEAPQARRLLALCDYRRTPGREVSRGQIREALATKKLQALARRHLQNLRRDASIEYR